MGASDLVDAAVDLDGEERACVHNRKDAELAGDFLCSKNFRRRDLCLISSDCRADFK
jgi:hypothetical protein